jgi:hypothetical protein
MKSAARSSRPVTGVYLNRGPFAFAKFSTATPHGIHFVEISLESEPNFLGTALTFGDATYVGGIQF